MQTRNMLTLPARCVILNWLLSKQWCTPAAALCRDASGQDVPSPLRLGRTSCVGNLQLKSNASNQAKVNQKKSNSKTATSNSQPNSKTALSKNVTPGKAMDGWTAWRYNQVCALRIWFSLCVPLRFLLFSLFFMF